MRVASAVRQIGVSLTPLQHALLATATFVVVVGGAAGGLWLMGNPLAGAPKEVVALSAEASEAPRVNLSEAAADPAAIAAADASFYANAYTDALGAAPEMTESPPGSAPQQGPTGDLQIAIVESGKTAPAQGAKTIASPLPRAPIAGLHAPSPKGPLPVVAPDGRSPLKAYARPLSGDPKKPKIALVLGGLGFNARLTQAAIDQLPPEVTLSFVPYAQDLQTWIDRARAHGHEVLIELPMEPFDSKTDDTGPQTLMASASSRENLDRLENILGRAVGYFGVTNYQGARFASSTVASTPITAALKSRGLGFIGNALGPRTSLAVEAQRAGLPFTSVDRIIDARREAEAIDEQLLQLEALALQNGSALGSGFAFPVTIDQIQNWAENLSMRGYVLAPASSVLEGRTQRK